MDALQNGGTPGAVTPGAPKMQKIVAEPFDKPNAPTGQDLLGAALAYASAGWPVFPCRWEDEPEEHFAKRRAENPGKNLTRGRAKAPLVPDPHATATTEASQLSYWWHAYPKAMIGLITGPRTGVWVLDVDVPKKEGDADGCATLAAFEAEHGALPETVEQRTGSGGRHLFFRMPSDGRTVKSRVRFAPGLDTRGEKPGYVVVPPSVHPSGGSYAWVNTPGDVELAEPPEWLLALVARKPEPQKVDTMTPSIELDQPENIVEASGWLLDHAPTAIEGEGGNDTTYRVAAELRDRGLSEDVAFGLMLRVWNNRCEPVWEPDDLAVPVRNAYRYANQGPPGGKTAEAAFAGLWTPSEVAEAETRPSGSEVTRPTVRVIFGAELMAKEYPNKPLIDGLLDEGESLAILAANGLGKSLALVDLAVTLADPEAANVWGRFHKTRCLSTLFFQSEVTGKALQKRLRAMLANEPRLWSVVSRLAFVSSGDSGRIAGNIEDDSVYSLFMRAIEHVKPDIIVIDPLVSYHGRDENSAEMRHPLDRITALQDATGTAVLLAHHVGENSADKTVFKGRGSTAIGDWVANSVLLEWEGKGREAIRVEHVKSRNFTETPPLWLARDAGLRLRPCPKPGSKQADGCEQAVAALVMLGGRVEQRKQLEDKLMELHDVGRSTAQRQVNEAMGAKRIIHGESSGRGMPLILAGEEWGTG